MATNGDFWDFLSGIGPREQPATFGKEELTTLLRRMMPGETRQLRAGDSTVTVAKYGEDEFRVNGGLPTSYPNTVRLLRSVGVE